MPFHQNIDLFEDTETDNPLSEPEITYFPRDEEITEDFTTTRKHECHKCHRQYIRSPDFKKHLRKCKKSLEEKKCPYCEETFYNVFNLREHVKKLHSHEQKLTCEDCGAKYFIQVDLDNHRKHHTDTICPHCGKKFQCRRQLKRHIDIHSATVYICSVCGISLGTKHTLGKHMVIHSEAKYKCKFCTKEFKLSGSFKLHMLGHSGLRPYKCIFCEGTFSDSSVCRTHMKNIHIVDYPKAVKLNGGPVSPVLLFEIPTLKELVATAEEQQNPKKEIRKYGEKKEEPKAFECPTCRQTLRSHRTLRQHMNTHKDILPHGCKNCGKRFKCSRSFKSHLLSHAGLRPYNCRFCNQSFVDNKSGIGHMKKIHSKEFAVLMNENGGQSVGCIVSIEIPRLDELRDGTESQQKRGRPVKKRVSVLDTSGENAIEYQRLLENVQKES
ncbi:hypothetical protein ACFFRR_004060 [Megaselia abdita]